MVSCLNMDIYRLDFCFMVIFLYFCGMENLKKYYNEKIKSKESLDFEKLPKNFILNLRNSLGFAIWNFHKAFKLREKFKSFLK